MLPSIFRGLSLARRNGHIEITYPNGIHQLARASGLAKAHGVELAAVDAGTWGLSFPAPAGAYPRPLKTFFAELNDLPAPYPPLDPAAFRAGPPLVSCIVVVTENLPFVQEQLLPSLQENSRKHAIEVIIVCNGSVDYADGSLPNVRGMRSDWGAVSKAYNAGARASRGQYLAFLHDDCIVCDPLWIEKCLQRLASGAHAVAGEYREVNSIGGVGMLKLPVAKCVPLFLRKSDFEAAGGYDEYHYIGYEDLDFTLAMARCGMKMVATDLRIHHFHGMSSTLKYGPMPGLAELFALAAVPRFAVMSRFKEYWGKGMRVDGVDFLQVATDLQLLYVLAKYRDFLGRSGNTAYELARTQLAQQIAAACPYPPEVALARFRELDRSTWQALNGRG